MGRKDMGLNLGQSEYYPYVLLFCQVGNKEEFIWNCLKLKHQVRGANLFFFLFPFVCG